MLQARKAQQGTARHFVPRWSRTWPGMNPLLQILTPHPFFSFQEPGTDRDPSSSYSLLYPSSSSPTFLLLQPFLPHHDFGPFHSFSQHILFFSLQVTVAESTFASFGSPTVVNRPAQPFKFASLLLRLRETATLRHSDGYATSFPIHFHFSLWPGATRTRGLVSISPPFLSRRLVPAILSQPCTPFQPPRPGERETKRNTNPDPTSTANNSYPP